MTNPSPEFTTHPQGALLSRCCGALMQGFGPVVQCVVCKQDAAVWNEERSGWDPPPGSAAKHTRTIPPTRVGTMPDPTMPPSSAVGPESVAYPPVGGVVTAPSQTSYEAWATRCLDCGDAVRVFASEEDARDTFERDASYEAESDAPHVVQLLGGVIAWEIIESTGGAA